MYASLRALALFVVVFIVVLRRRRSRPVDPGRPELVPVAFAAVVFCIVFDARIVCSAAMALAVIVGGQGAYRGTNAWSSIGRRHGGVVQDARAASTRSR